jgi:hypothetical protein
MVLNETKEMMEDMQNKDSEYYEIAESKEISPKKLSKFAKNEKWYVR